MLIADWGNQHSYASGHEIRRAFSESLLIF